MIWSCSTRYYRMRPVHHGSSSQCSSSADRLNTLSQRCSALLLVSGLRGLACGRPHSLPTFCFNEPGLANKKKQYSQLSESRGEGIHGWVQSRSWNPQRQGNDSQQQPMLILTASEMSTDRMLVDVWMVRSIESYQSITGWNGWTMAMVERKSQRTRSNGSRQCMWG